MSDKQLRLLVCGDRNWTDGGLIGDWLSTMRGDNPDMLLCHGANGVSYIDGHTVKPDKRTQRELAEYEAQRTSDNAVGGPSRGEEP